MCKPVLQARQFRTRSPLSPRFSASPTATLRFLFRACSVNGAVNASRRRRTFLSPNPGRLESAAGEASTIEEKDCMEFERSGVQRRAQEEGECARS